MSLEPELDSIRRRLFRDIDRVAETLDGLDDEQVAAQEDGADICPDGEPRRAQAAR